MDPETLPADAFAATEEELRIARARAELPDPGAALNLYDIEVCAVSGVWNACRGSLRGEGIRAEGAHTDGVGVLPLNGR